MRARTAALVGPVVADLRGAGYVVTVTEDVEVPHRHGGRPPARTVLVSTPEGGGNGFPTGEPGDPVDADAVCAAAHALQDGIVDGGYHATGTATIWPVCPRHPGVHPLTPTVRGPDVVWACPGTGEAICRVGHLADLHPAPQRRD